VVREGLRLLEQREQEDQATIEWLRAAAKGGFDDIERGDYVTLRSDKEIDDFIDRPWGRGFSRIRSRAETCLSAAPVRPLVPLAPLRRTV